MNHWDTVKNVRGIYKVTNKINGKVYIWERTKDFVLRNSNCSRVNLGYDSNIVRHGRYRVYNKNS